MLWIVDNDDMLCIPEVRIPLPVLGKSAQFAVVCREHKSRDITLVKLTRHKKPSKR